jgi:hypothetical protein
MTLVAGAAVDTTLLNALKHLSSNPRAPRLKPQAHRLKAVPGRALLKHRSKVYWLKSFYRRVIFE